MLRGAQSPLGQPLRRYDSCQYSTLCFLSVKIFQFYHCIPVEAQKDYHRLRGNFRTTPSFGGGRSQPDFPTSYTPPYSPGRPGGGRSQTPDKTRWPTYPTPPSRWTHTPMVTTTRRTWPTPPWGSRGEGGAGRPTWYRTTPRRKTQPTTTPIPTTPTTPTLPPSESNQPSSTTVLLFHPSL